MKAIPMLGMVMQLKSAKSPKKLPKDAPAEPAGPTPGDYKPPTPAERMKENARHSKVRATADWVDGHIDSKKHAEIHKRADQVLTGQVSVRKLPKGW